MNIKKIKPKDMFVYMLSLAFGISFVAIYFLTTYVLEGGKDDSNMQWIFPIVIFPVLIIISNQAIKYSHFHTLELCAIAVGLFFAHWESLLNILIIRYMFYEMFMYVYRNHIIKKTDYEE